MYASAFPGVDPLTLPTPEEVAKSIVPLCLPGCTESGKLYDFRAGKFLEFHPPPNGHCHEPLCGAPFNGRESWVFNDTVGQRHRRACKFSRENVRPQGD